MKKTAPGRELLSFSSSWQAKAIKYVYTYTYIA